KRRSSLHLAHHELPVQRQPPPPSNPPTLSLHDALPIFNPYLLMESAEDLVRADRIRGVSETAAVANVLSALNKGLLKIMSKMGISTVQSYHGVQTLQAVGLAADCIDRYSTSTPHQRGGHTI